MVHQAIKNTFDKYVQKVHDLGNGNFGLRDGFLVPDLRITTPYPRSGALLLRNDTFRDGWDCGRLAFRIGEELKEKGFKVKYKFATGRGGSTQNYTEVLDPETKQWVQVDATPWYEQLNPGHKEAGEHLGKTKDDYATIILTNQSGIMLSVEKQADSLFIETYLLGGYESLKDELAELTELINGCGPLRDTTKPQYSLRLWSKLCKSVVDGTLDQVNVLAEVLDSKRIHGYKEKMREGEWKEKPEETLEMLARDGVIRLRVEGYADFLSNTTFAIIKTDTPAKGREELEYLDIIAGQYPIRQNIVRNVRENLGALTNMLFNLRPFIKTTDGEFEVDVVNGRYSQTRARHLKEV